MRTMADSDVAADLPAGCDLYAAYCDGQAVFGQPQSYREAVARFPGVPVLSISVDGNPADIGDVEKGALTIQQAIAIGYKTVYCSLANWAANINAYSAAGAPPPNWWVAAYPGSGAIIAAGAVAHQYVDAGPYDLSVVADYWPGVDPSPVPPPEEIPVEPFVAIPSAGAAPLPQYLVIPENLTKLWITSEADLAYFLKQCDQTAAQPLNAATLANFTTIGAQPAL